LALQIMYSTSATTTTTTHVASTSFNISWLYVYSSQLFAVSLITIFMIGVVVYVFRWTQVHTLRATRIVVQVRDTKPPPRSRPTPKAVPIIVQPRPIPLFHRQLETREEAFARATPTRSNHKSSNGIKLIKREDER
jgi:hypothetical protein